MPHLYSAVVPTAAWLFQLVYRLLWLFREPLALTTSLTVSNYITALARASVQYSLVQQERRWYFLYTHARHLEDDIGTAVHSGKSNEVWFCSFPSILLWYPFSCMQSSSIELLELKYSTPSLCVLPQLSLYPVASALHRSYMLPTVPSMTELFP